MTGPALKGRSRRKQPVIAWTAPAGMPTPRSRWIRRAAPCGLTLPLVPDRGRNRRPIPQCRVPINDKPSTNGLSIPLSGPSSSFTGRRTCRTVRSRPPASVIRRPPRPHWTAPESSFSPRPLGRLKRDMPWLGRPPRDDPAAAPRLTGFEFYSRIRQARPSAIFQIKLIYLIYDVFGPIPLARFLILTSAARRHRTRGPMPGAGKGPKFKIPGNAGRTTSWR